MSEKGKTHITIKMNKEVYTLPINGFVLTFNTKNEYLVYNAFNGMYYGEITSKEYNRVKELLEGEDES